MAILDLGVGGGRTTPYLSQKAARYVGVDYSEEMVQSCRRKFPELEFQVCDASDLSGFSDSSFDAIVIAFNGLDCVSPAERRRQCLRECARVLRAGGVLIFSSHNPRSIVVRPAWDRERLRAFARKLVSEQSIFFPATLWSLTGAKGLHSVLRAVVESAGRVLRRVPKPAFWRGEGYLFDFAHGGWMTHCWIPARVCEELARFDFRQRLFWGMTIPDAAASWLPIGTTTFSARKVRRVNFALKRPDAGSGRPEGPRSVECPGVPDGSSGSFLYLGVGDGGGPRLSTRR